VKYAIEIKTTTAGKAGRYVIPILQLQEMVSQLRDNKSRPLLLLIDESQLEFGNFGYNWFYEDF
jgi:hypothetical protein